LIVIVFAINFAYAQWTNVSGTNNIANTNSGNVGIGTTSPGATLSVNGNGNFYQEINVAGVSGGTSTFWGALTVQNNKATTLTGTLDVTGQTTMAGNVGINYAPQSNIRTFIYDNSANYGLVVQQDGTGPIASFTNGGISRLYVASSGIGIGTTSPAYLLDASGVIHSSVSSGNNLIISKVTGASLAFDNGSGTQTGMIEAGTSDNHLEFWTNTATNSGIAERMRITNTGNILVGKTSQTNPGYILDVAGPVRANEIVVNTNGADFVFEPTYKLPSISSIEKYIKLNHHLPDIPSAKQMQAEGLSVGENQVKLLQKVEELTLYLIEKDKQLKAQQEQIDALIVKVNALVKQTSK